MLSIKRSRSSTTSAVTSNCAAGRSGVKLMSMALSFGRCAGLVGGHGSSGTDENSLKGKFDSRLHPLQKRLGIDAHENDQRQDRRQNNALSCGKIEKLGIFRIG